MKKLNFAAIAGFLLCAHIHVVIAQNNLQSDSIQLLFPNQQKLQTELEKFSMKMLAFPAEQTCPSLGSARIQKFPIEGVNPPMDNPTLKFGDFPPGFGKDRDINIFWLHGLNGNTGSWDVAAHATQFGYPDIFPARKARSIRGPASSSSHAVQFYSENLGITGAARDLENAAPIYLNNSNKTKWDYIIAHSQGGIVGREWLRQMDQSPASFQRFANGLVTFGTSHAGAEILNNTRPNMRNKLPNFFKEACTALGGALVVPKINSNLYTRLLISNDMRQMLMNSACGLSSNLIIPFALDNYFKATTNDFYVGAPFLVGTATKQGLSQYELDVPVVQYYGVEQQPVMWRFMSSSLKIGHDYLDNDQKIFGYDKDEQLQEKVEEMIADFDARAMLQDREAEHYRKLEIGLYSGTILLPVMLPFAILTTTRKNAAIENKHAFLKAKNWLSDANEVYQIELLGEKTTKTELECHLIEELDCYDPVNNPKGMMPPVKLRIEKKYKGVGAFCTDKSIASKYTNFEFPGNDGTLWKGNCEGVQTFYGTFKTVFVAPENDGVVLANSAAHRLKVKQGVSHAIKLMPNTNHDQMKNSTETKLALTELYDGKMGHFFSIDFR